MVKRRLSIEKIIDLYKKGESTKNIAEKAGVSSRYIRMLLTKHNVQKRPRGSWKRKHNLNEHYFKKWSNNMAYILGFFCADGFIATDNQTVSISQKDKNILLRIRNELQSEQPLYYNEKTGVYMLNFHSKVMKDDLITLHGITPNKSLTLNFPKIPSRFLPHFIRGYFDGDGFVNYERRIVSFVGGSKLFMSKLKETLDNRGFTTELQHFNNCYRLFLTGRKSIKLFSELIYKDKDIYLERKHYEFCKEKLPLEKLKDNKLKRTKAAVNSRKENLIRLVNNGVCIDEAIMQIGIQKSTLTKWFKDDKEFKERFNHCSSNKRG
ncbi:LAGLIDADG family homing endonuclease [Bacillus sp. SCS-153A]|uniref:LAGLIDADG family homing endonuclease n=1 Tax=Rossellomorea sedimentorum TaxID=3115294 RepID=UPI003905FA62